MIDINNIERAIIRRAIRHYKKHGFPFTKLSDFELLLDFKNLLLAESGVKKGYKYNGEVYYSVASGNSGLEFCKHYMPHQYKVKVFGSMGSPVDAFNKKRLLKKSIKMAYQYHQSKMGDRSVRTYLSRVEWHQFATNFRPVSAKSIYERYLKNNSIAYDYCSGFGGRLAGFLASKFAKTSKYIGVDPSTESFNGLNNIIKFCNAQKNAIIHNVCAEDFCPEEYIGKVDFAFSSPPYFCKELYSEEKTQSYKKYPEYKIWRKQFLKRTIENCFRLLKPGGHFAINIADIKIKGKEFNCGDDAKKYAEILFGEMKELLVLPMNSLFGVEDTPKKMEPIYVYQKKEK